MAQTSSTGPEASGPTADPAHAASLLARIIDESDERIAAIDAGYRFTVVTRAFREDFEREFGVAIAPGTDLREALASWPEQCAQLVSYWARALAGEEHSVVIPAGGAGGAGAAATYYEARFRPLRGAGARIEGAFQLLRDVTVQEEARHEAERCGRVEAELRQSRDLLQAVLDATADAVFVKDLEGRYVMINPAGARMVGRSIEDTIGKDDYAIFERATAERAIARDREVIEAGESLTSEQSGTAAGKTRVFLTTKSPLRDARGEVIGVVGIARDITESVRSERERRRTERALRILAEASAVLADSLDYEVTLRRVAELAVPDIADWCAVDLLGEDGEIRRVATAHQDPERARMADEHMRRFPERLDAPVGVGAVIRTGRSVLLPGIPDWVYRRAASEPERLELLRALDLRSILIVPLEVGAVRFGAISLMQGESGRRFTEADLPLAEELARRAAGAIQNARAYRAEHDARTAAERASEAKNQFLAIMSHELRTPLTAVMGYADLLASEISGPLTDRQHEHVARIQQSAFHLISIIDEILIFARTEAGKEEVRVATVDAAAIARDVAALLEPKAAAKGLALRTTNLDGPAPLDTDGGKLRQILANLAGNAVKFTERGEVVLELDASVAGHVVFHVRDTGPGIPGDQHERIFEPFTQLDGSITREKGGTGLGLTICRRLARLLGGTVTVDSRPGAGSTFTLRVPGRPTGE
ncbi:MAG TPA: ATP-binding protein [Longimicrobiales bacterium]